MHIREVQLECGDLAGTRQFYTDVLGMLLVNVGGDGLRIDAGESLLNFTVNKTEKPFYHFAFTIPAGQFDEAHAWVGSRVKLLPVKGDSTIAEFTNWNARSFYCYDNNGNILEYIARFDLPFTAERSFTGASVVSISEIGIVTDDVMRYCHELEQYQGLKFFSRQPPQPDFAVVGNDEGLLIVVKKGRAWYPNAGHAAKFTSRILLHDNGRNFQLETGSEGGGG
jgi:catechol 2,3-dioxygenase-like lactoylglutathione lyase family enzyme